MSSRGAILVAAAAGLLSAAREARGQAAIASDLWRVAAGTLVVPSPLADDGSAALWTPATALPREGAAVRVGVEAIHAPSEVGVSGGIATLGIRLGGLGTLNAVYGRLGIDGLVRTETSPEGLGGDIPVFAEVVSVGFARQINPGVVAGLAVRSVSGRLDVSERSQAGLDIGIRYADPSRVTIAFATRFLDPTFRQSEQAASYSVAASYQTTSSPMWGTTGVVILRLWSHADSRRGSAAPAVRRAEPGWDRRAGRRRCPRGRGGRRGLAQPDGTGGERRPLPHLPRPRRRGQRFRSDLPVRSHRGDAVSSLLDLPPAAARATLETWLAQRGDKPYRVYQVLPRLWQRPVRRWADATELPVALRQALDAEWPLPSLMLEVRQESRDGTEKILWRLPDGEAIESVLIPEGSRRTLCISSQAGCPLRCAFCATGTMGLKRDLARVGDRGAGTRAAAGSRPGQADQRRVHGDG